MKNEIVSKERGIREAEIKERRKNSKKRKILEGERKREREREKGERGPRKC